jgi:glutathione S-transferase
MSASFQDLEPAMITLYLYPKLFGLPDNNPFGLKVDTFLRLACIQYQSEHIINTQDAPHGQLPFLIDDDVIVSDSNKMIAYLAEKYQTDFDRDLSAAQKNTAFLVTRMLDSNLYWVMSYSRWQDERYWPLFKQEFLRNVPTFSESELEVPRQYNLQKYHYQGIGRYEVDAIYQMGIDNLNAIQSLLGDQRFLFGDKICTVDASCYGFLANIFYFEIDTPLRDTIRSHQNLVDYLKRVRQLLNY